MGRNTIGRTLKITIATYVSCFGLFSTAYAGAGGGPAPVIGAGLPVLGVVGGAYWLYRRFKGRNRND
jgi:hypothetical protein